MLFQFKDFIVDHSVIAAVQSLVPYGEGMEKCTVCLKNGTRFNTAVTKEEIADAFKKQGLILNEI